MNRKIGLQFFQLDVDFFEDEKIQFVSARFGSKGEVIAIRLLCKIYRQGYFINWCDDMALLFSKGAGVAPSLANEVVNELLKRGFFDETVFKSFSILTSKGIQERYFDACLKAKRKDVFCNVDYMLIDVSAYSNLRLFSDLSSQNSDISSQNAGVLSQNSGVLKQSKVKESKVKENKKEIVGTEVPTLPPAKKPKKEPKQQTETFPLDSVEYISSKFLADRILKKDPGNTKVPRTEEGLQKWAVHIDYILRIDKRSKEQLRKALLYATKHHYWSGKILSTKKLRVEFNALIMEIIQKETKNDGKYTKNFNSHREKNKIHPGEIPEGERLLKREAELGIGQDIGDTDTIY